jgi:hypothetical protein
MCFCASPAHSPRVRTDPAWDNDKEIKGYVTFMSKSCEPSNSCAYQRDIGEYDRCEHQYEPHAYPDLHKRRLVGETSPQQLPASNIAITRRS